MLFSRDDLLGLFKLHDVTRKGRISKAQYLEIMKSVGAPSGSFSQSPKGSENDSISLETFLDESASALASIEFQ